MLVQGQFEAVFVVGLPHSLQAQRHAFGITVSTAWADLGATRQRIPSGFRPFDTRVCTHLFSPNRGSTRKLSTKTHLFRKVANQVAHIAGKSLVRFGPLSHCALQTSDSRGVHSWNWSLLTDR